MNIVIAGASRGIGKAAAERFSADGHQLFLIARNFESFNSVPEGAKLYAADLSKSEDVKTVAEAITADAGVVDLLINNVGVMIMKRFRDMTNEDILTLLNTNLAAHMLLTKALLPTLEKSESSRIIFMSSMAAKSSIAGESVYAATKAGITQFASVLRNEFGARIPVSAVHAWGCDTWGAENPQDFLQPSDIADVFHFIANTPRTMLVESIELSNPVQWRGSEAPWSPNIQESSSS